MARHKCTEKDISILLDTLENSEHSDCNTEFDESYVPNEIENNSTLDSSESDKDESLLPRKSTLRKSTLRRSTLQMEQVPLRLKLRRVTRHSMYKIDTESEDERPKTLINKLITTEKLRRSQDENQIPHNKRTVKLPARYSDYECFSSKLPQKEQISCDKKKLSVISPNTRRKKQVDEQAKDDSDNLDCIYNSPLSTKISIRSGISKGIKRDHVCATESNIVIEDNITPKVRKVKYSKSIDEKSTRKTADKVSPDKNVTINSKMDTTKDEPLSATPRRSRTERNNRRGVLTNVSNKYEPTFENESKNNINEIDDICKVAEELSIKTPKQRKKDVKSTNESSLAQNTLSTPKSHRSSLKHSALTPSVKMRTETLVKSITPLQEVRCRLHVSVVPKSLPCREQEFNDIYMFLEGKLMDNSGGCIYISGVPGTGKTATVNEVIKCLKRSVEKNKLNHFDFIDINGMKLSEPRQAYVQILKQLSGKVLTWEQAYNALEKRFNSKTQKPMTLLLVDELDLLYTKRQDVIYNILDWPTKVSARLVVITIANTMDLPERVLMGRVTSRLGLTRVTFQPYNYKQLQEIVLARLKDAYIFKNEAIQLIARKVSAVSGDARRALDICRRAAEITETRGGNIITIEDVNEALLEMIANPKVQAIRHCSKFEQIFLQAMCAEVTRIGVEEVCFLNVYKQFGSLCSFDGYEVPNVTQVLDICARLDDYRLLICEYSGSGIHQRILLNVSKDDIFYATTINK